MGGPVVIRTVALQKWFGRHHVLRGIDLEVQRGEVLVIIGPSGSGKSTLLKCLNFLEQYEEGSVCFEDVLVGYRDVGGRRVLRLRRMGLAHEVPGGGGGHRRGRRVGW